ncbi:hypothetical protein GCM10020229_76930 [Kitasatospora albolonga]
MTEPPEDSTAVVIELTALPVAGTSNRTVIEFETLGTVAIDVLLPEINTLLNACAVGMLDLDRRTHQGFDRNNVH